MTESHLSIECTLLQILKKTQMSARWWMNPGKN